MHFVVLLYKQRERRRGGVIVFRVNELLFREEEEPSKEVVPRLGCVTKLATRRKEVVLCACIAVNIPWVLGTFAGSDVFGDMEVFAVTNTSPKFPALIIRFLF